MYISTLLIRKGDTLFFYSLKEGLRMNELEISNNTTFESIKHVDENGFEFWYARELMNVLEYTKWQNFIKVIDKAKIACEKSSNNAFEQFTAFCQNNIFRFQFRCFAIYGK